MIELLFTSPFFLRALVAGVCIGILAPVIGIFLTVRRESLIADTLAHASLAGVAFGLLFGIDAVLAAAITAVFAALAIERVKASRRVNIEAILALFLSGSLAFAVVALSAMHAFGAGVMTYLFGSIVTVQMNDVVVIVALTISILCIVAWKYRDFFALSFDEDVARASGFFVTRDAMLLAAITAVTVAVSLRVVGALLIGALLVIPVLAAIEWGRGFLATMLLAVFFSVLSVLSGFFLAAIFDLATSGTIVLCAIACFFGMRLRGVIRG